MNLKDDPVTELFPASDNKSFMLDGIVFPIMFGKMRFEFPVPSASLQQTSTLGSQNCSWKQLK